ncbi:MAG: 30S ribosomal protein S9 [Candidatus Bathyarchaeota archaeon B63]|nr:MAG: 30S ribosomal protein S9 [Candidatus Bathyarchaeota archaeon B63]
MDDVPARKVLVISGKRKTAIAKAIIREGRGRIRINNIPLEIYQPEIAREKIKEPLLLAGEDVWRKLDIKIKVKGGGFMGQAEASRIALARGLIKWTKSSHLRTVFMKYDRTMVAGDPRRKESKKFGGRGARARFQKSYR